METTSNAADIKDDYTAGILVGVIAVLGLFSNGLSILTVFRKKHMHNSFGYTCISHAIGGAGVLVVFAVWVTPLLFLSPDHVPAVMAIPRVSYTMGQMMELFYYGAIYTHVLLACNRFCVICRPLSYASCFNVRMTMKWTAAVWVIAFAQSVIYQIDGCHYFFDPSTLQFVYSDTECGQFLSMRVELCINIAFCIFILTIDTITSIKLKLSSKVGVAHAQVSPAMMHKRRSQEVRFFCQSVCSEMTIIVCFSSFWGFSRLAHSKWAMFLLITVAWESLHALDGLVLIAFNRNIHWLWLCPRRKMKNKHLTTQGVWGVHAPPLSSLNRSHSKIVVRPPPSHHTRC